MSPRCTRPSCSSLSTPCSPQPPARGSTETVAHIPRHPSVTQAARTPVPPGGGGGIGGMGRSWDWSMTALPHGASLGPCPAFFGGWPGMSSGPAAAVQVPHPPPPPRTMILQMHTPAHTSQCWSRQTPAWTRSVHLDAPGQRHRQQPVSRTAEPRSSQTGQVIRGLR